MRINPKYSSVCGNRIGMYRTDQCYECKFLSECDKYYNEETGEFDYPYVKLTHVGSLHIKAKKGGTYDREISKLPFRD